MLRANLLKMRGKKTRLTVARDLDITPQMLGAIERGTRTPSLLLAKKIADYFKVSIEYLFFED